MDFDLSFYKDKKVLLTGHTGFKGSWMSVMLVNAGAKVIGYSTCSKSETRLFDLCGVDEYSDVSEPPIPDGGAIPIPEMRTTHSENITTLKTGRSIIS